MKAPTVSVIMATYNHVDFVAQSIESVLAQEGVDFEFIISDDGSTDGTRELIGTIKDKRIRYFPNTVNRGACIVTNELIERSKGEYIALINSDDYWSTSDKLSYQINVLKNNPKVGACFGRVNFVDKNDKEIKKESLPFGYVFDQENRSKGKWLRYFFDYGNCICHPTMLIRKSCYNEVGLYNNALRQLPDLDMWVRLVKKYDIFVSDRELINFRITPGENTSSQTSSNSIRTINEHYLIAESFFDKLELLDLQDGFSDLLKFKKIPSIEHFEIEKSRLYFNDNQWLGKPYRMIGLIKMFKLLNNPDYKSILVNDFEIDDLWYQKKMGDIDVLRPKIIEDIKGKTRTFRIGLSRFLAFRQKK